MTGKKNELIEFLDTIEDELEELLKTAEEYFEEVSNDEWKNDLSDIIDKIKIFQREEKFPVEIHFKIADLPSSGGYLFYTFNLYKKNILYVLRVISNMIMWVERYYKEDVKKTTKTKGISKKNMTGKSKNIWEYDVALSFAGEDRNYVEEVAEELKKLNLKVFYDKDEIVELWGKDLADHFDYLYRKKSRFCVIFISSYYSEKNWTNHERKSALARAIEQREEYILPVRFDNTELSGLAPTIGYIDAIKYSPEELAKLIKEKCGN